MLSTNDHHDPNSLLISINTGTSASMTPAAVALAAVVMGSSKAPPVFVMIDDTDGSPMLPGVAVGVTAPAPMMMIC